MVFASLLCSNNYAARTLLTSSSNLSLKAQCRSMVSSTVRIIVLKDLPEGMAYAGDVTEVKAGFARNYLIPQKMALYATKQNFIRMNMKDPNHETPEERKARLERESQNEGEADSRAADLLRTYLRNKSVEIKRNTEPGTFKLKPGMVDAKAIRQKLSKQLKIDLEPHEKVHLYPTAIASAASLTEEMMDSLIAELGDPDQRCDVQIRQLGTYVARISLRGGYSIPLKVRVVKR